MSHKPIFIIGISLFFWAGSMPVYAQESVKPGFVTAIPSKKTEGPLASGNGQVNFSIQQETDQLDFAQGLLSRGMYDMAISQYQKFISDYPHSPSLPEAYLSLGEGYFLSQDFNKAVDAFNRFNQLYPNSEQLPMSLLRLGQIDIQQKKYDEALKDLTSIEAQKQLKGEMLQSFYFYTAQAYQGKIDIASALDYFQKAAQVEGASAYTAYALKEIGQIQAQNGHYSEAMDAYAKSMSLAGDDSLKGELNYRAAELQFLSGKYADAVKGFGQVISQYPNLEYTNEALANLLLSYFNLGQYDELLNEYQKDAQKIKNDDTFYSIHFAAVLAYIELKKYEQANELLDRMLALPALKSNERAKIFIKKADILIREKKYKDGVALLDAYSSENTGSADENFFLKAQGYYGLGDYDHAFNFFENVSSNFPESRFVKSALLGEAHARRQMGRNKESEVLFLKYYNTQDDPNLKSEALFDAVMTSVQSSDVNEIISNAQEYIKAFPNGEKYSEVLLILADTYGKNNHLQEAVKLLQGYLAKPESVQRPNSAYFLLGFDQQLLGNSDQALAAYAQVDGQKEEGKFYLAALKNLAIIYLEQKKEDQARTYFDQLISKADQNDLQIKTYVWVCNEYLKLQKYDDVLRIAALAEKKFSQSSLLEIEYFKAEALRGQGSCDEADKIYSQVTSSKEKNVYTGSAHIGYGLCLMKANKFDEAKQEFKKALDENPDDYTVTAHARFEMANLEGSQGNFGEALKLYILVATIYDNDYFCSESLLRAAKISERLERKGDALKMYLEVLAKYKNSTAAQYAGERVGLLK
ncbi:MAG: tetratricopeptide repeat protein [Candidatus Omnitrophica bacterium]|nr:tetratricopeptide repeat protein [Candidatus Omnitrophota bacterium]